MKCSSTLNCLVLSTDYTREKVQVDLLPPSRRSTRGSKSVESAVYAYIRAIRTLGRTTVNTIEIAAALSIPVSKVNAALDALRRKGVRVA